LFISTTEFIYLLFLMTQSVQLFGSWKFEQQSWVLARHWHLSVQRICWGLQLWSVGFYLLV